MLADILREEEIVALAENVNLPHGRKMELLREFLRKKRYLLKPSPPSSPSPNGRGGKADAVSQGVRVEKQKGRWLKRCPGTKKHLCCNYYVINNAMGCPFNCTYCYLHAYVNSGREITIYNNYDALLAELEDFFQKHAGEHLRIGTGEFSDSLALDKHTGLSKQLIELFAGQNDHLLELKTKSVAVDHLLNLDHRGQTVFAWSVNPEGLVRSEELGTEALSTRMGAAKKCATVGYPVAFHFDPIIYYAGWEEEYKEVVDLIFTSIPADKIAWISLGALRYPLALKDIIEEKFPHSRITLGDLDVGPDKKLRYFEPIRIEIFSKMQNFIRSHSKDVYVYLCMESEAVWKGAGIGNAEGGEYGKYFKFNLQL
jgi:spore photoproduct lyase